MLFEERAQIFFQTVIDSGQRLEDADRRGTGEGRRAHAAIAERGDDGEDAVDQRARGKDKGKQKPGEHFEQYDESKEQERIAIYTPDPGGAITVDGRPLALPVKPLDARAAGLSVVHQNLGLVDDRTVWENVRLGRFRAAGRFSRRIDGRAEREAVEAVFDRLGTRVDVNERVGELSAEDRAAVAIARAMQDHQPGGGLIIFDESTRAMGKAARGRFFGLVRSVIDGGASVLMISHQLEEVVEVTDRVTVLRDGQVVETGIPTKDIDEAGLTRLMLGRHLVTHHRVDSHATDEVAAQVRNLVVRSVKGLDIDLKKGEIVGLTGLVGSGAVAVAEAIGGARQARAGELTVNGRKLSLKPRRDSTQEFIAAGVAFVAERRLEQGLAAELSVTQNLTLPRVRARGSRTRIGGGWQAEETAAMIKKLDIKPPDPHKTVGTLSGGNQQKVLLGKWLAGKPELLVLHEPTQAVDVGARHDIIEAIREAARGRLRRAHLVGRRGRPRRALRPGAGLP